MPVSKTSNSRIAGICCSLPDNPVLVEELSNDVFDIEQIRKVSSIVGVKTLYRAKPDQTTADLCYAAAKRLMTDLSWDKDTIDGLIFISQTPDYITPSTSCVLHGLLDLPVDCLTLDVNLGCSGYVYGLWLASQMVHSKTCKRIILLVGDTLSKTVSEEDKGTALLFGDGASATALEYTDKPVESTFLLRANGKGAEHLIIPAGGFRNPVNDTTKARNKDEEGNVRTQENFHMNGLEVFSFAVREVPVIIKDTMQAHGWSEQDVDMLLLHQANNYMLNFIARKARFPMDKVPLNIDKFGNTSGATIPLLICDTLKEQVSEKTVNVVMSGFGVGLSWAAAAIPLKDIVFSDFVYV